MSAREIPALPEVVLTLAADIKSELLDPEHVKRLHGKRNCYGAGCRGPLCQRADRHFNRDRYAQARRREGKPYQPSPLRRDDRDDELDAALVVYMTHQRLIEIHVRLSELYSEIA